jgi:hypothetical protein
MLRETVQHLYCTHYEVRTPDMAPTGRHVEETKQLIFAAHTDKTKQHANQLKH